VNASYDKASAVVVLPAVGAGRLGDTDLRQWLAKGEVSLCDEPRSLLASVLEELGQAPPDRGLAALRFWGQTGDRAAAWMAAADAVCLEPRLDHLCLHAVPPDSVTVPELRALFDHLQATLGGDSGVGFARLGVYGYVTAPEPFSTAALPASAIDGRRPDAFLPAGEGGGAYRRLLSEIEMALHDHPVNLERQADGRLPVNSLWLWGGGVSPEQETRPMPPLFGDDALLRGHWLRHTGVVDGWPGSIAACADASVAGFVAVAPATEPGTMPALLAELRSLLQRGRLPRLVLLFRDGIRVELRRSHGLRVWRRRHPLLDAEGPGA